MTLKMIIGFSTYFSKMNLKNFLLEKVEDNI